MDIIPLEVALSIFYNIDFGRKNLLSGSTTLVNHCQQSIIDDKINKLINNTFLLELLDLVGYKM